MGAAKPVRSRPSLFIPKKKLFFMLCLSLSTCAASTEWDPNMPIELQKLLDAARIRLFPAPEREAQRRSFAYGNTKIENPRITRQTVDEQAERLRSQKTPR
jgi:hypothetical protein